MVKIFPSRHCPGQQDFWQMHILADQSWMKHPESMCCCSGPVGLQPQRFQAWPVGHTDSLTGFVLSTSQGRAGKHCTTELIPVQEPSPTSPAPAPSDWSPTRPHNCRTGFSSHHVLELIPWWKGQKGTSMKPSFDWYVTLRPLTQQPQLLARSGVWLSLVQGCGYTGKPPTPSHSGDQREGNSLSTLTG